MTTTSLMPEPRQRYYNNDGTLAAGCLLYTYAAGTTTPKATYTDSAGLVPHANPIVLDAKGEAVIYFSGSYKVDLKTAAGVQITGYPVDNYVTDGAGTLRADLAASTGAALIGGGGQVVSSIAALRALLKTSASSKAFVTGYYADGDGGGGAYYYDSSDTTTTDNGGTVIVASDGGRWKLAHLGTVTARQFGAKGDASTDDRAAIIAADTWCAANGYELFFTRGVYRCSDGVARTAAWRGEHAPQLAPFPLTGDDKQYLRPGYKHLIPGASLLFTGTGTQTATTQRSDGFASFTYCVKDATTGLHMKNLAIVLDVDVYNSGGTLTAYGADNSADYDVGHYIDDAAQTLCEDVVVFGYFPLAGTAIRSLAGNDDPDYTIFRGGSTMGRYGLALVGSQTNDGFDAGLSGTMSYGMDIFTLDHHSRSSSTAATIYAAADTWACIYIDGYTDASSADINGHYFFGGSIRTYAIHPVVLDEASQTNFIGIIHETSDFATATFAASKQWIASAETENVGIANSRFSGDVGLLGASFAGAMKGQLTIQNCPGLAIGGGLLVAEKDPGSSTAYWIKIGGASGATGDPAIQLGSGAATSSSTGWSIRRDIDASDLLDFKWAGTSVFSVDTTGAIGRLALRSGNLTIAAGVVTVAALSMYAIDTEAAAAADDLDTINGGVDGQVLYLRSAASARDVTVTEAGNIRLNSAGSFVLSNPQDRIVLQYDGSVWNEVSRSDNTA